MTEYDYSPDAYEKYLATQQRIARWVDETQKYPPANPFVPTAAGSVTSNGHQHSPRGSPQHGSASPVSPQAVYSAYRPTPVRTYSTPATPQPEHDRRSRSRSRTMHDSSSHHHHHGHTSSRHHSSHRQSRSSSVTPTSAVSPTYGYTMYPSNTTSPTVVTQSAQPIIVPTAGGYVIVPPIGRRMEVINAAEYTNSRGTSTTKKESDNKPFFKKIFGGLTSSNSRRSKSSHHHSGRKHHRRDSY